MIRLEHLGKTFGKREALRDLSLHVPAGEVFGLLGHNGAGKSTTFGLILGHLRPTTGKAMIRGISVQRERARAMQNVGAIFEAPAFYDYLSGWDNLRILTAYSARSDEKDMLDTVRFVGLAERIADPVRVYSHGMRQRLALAQALLPRPDLVLLDEPAEGLDPEGIHEMRHLILRLNRERGMTVVLSSHLLSEVEQMCHRIAILNKGSLVFSGRWEDLRREGARFRLQVDDWPKAAAVACDCGASTADGGIVVLPDGYDPADFVVALVAAGLRVRGFEPVRQSLEELYLQKVGEQ